MRLKIYLSMFSVALAGMTFAQQQAQVLDVQPTPVQHEVSAVTPKVIWTRGAHSAKGGAEVEVYYSEGFSNGLAGEGDNGAWTTEGPEGDLWFQAFPPLNDGGYNTDVIVPEYGDVYPNYMDGVNDDVIPFTTADDGFMMFDADRANSTQTDPESETPSATFNLLDAQMISPAIDLTGVENALLSFWERWRICCFAYDDALTLDFSIDGGTSWIPFSLHALTPELVVSGAGGPFLEGEPAIDISPFLQGASDLSDCRIRVRWNPAEQINSEGNAIPASHYYAMIDDINIIGLPQNDLVAGATFFNNYWLSDDVDLGTGYVHGFENFSQPDYSTRAFNFGTIVSNEGSDEQTGVMLTVRAFYDGEAIDEEGTWSTPMEETLTLASGETDTLLINAIAPSWWIDDASNPAPGLYTFEFEVTQDQEEQRPSDNFGLDRGTRISTDVDNDGFAFMQNDRNQYTNFYGTLGEDVIWANRFTFDEIDVDNNLLITHVEFALAGTAQASTAIGEEVYINVGAGNVFEGEGDDLDAVDRFFDEEEIVYVTLEEDLTTTGTLNWISVELPTPILAEPGTIYQAELHTPPIGFDAIIPCQTNGQEAGASALYQYSPAQGDPGWAILGGADAQINEYLATAIRFRTQDGVFQNTNDVLTYESGIKLMQNYPNPVVDNTMIQFQLDESSPVTFEVFDITGRLVHQDDLGEVNRLETRIITFDASEFAAGTYTYSITTDTERVSRKMSIK